MTTPAVLQIEGLSVRFATEFGSLDAVNQAALTVRRAECVALVGESGSGKSTVALAAIGLLPGNATAHGRVLVDELDMISAPESQRSTRRGNAVSMVFQEPATALDPLTRVGDQVAQVFRNHRTVTRAQARQQAVELLDRVGLPEPAQRARAFPFELSGGQRQRVVIAMALANGPHLLIADEPTTALDVVVQAEILDLLRDVTREFDTGVLLVTHNMGVVADFADRVAVMHEGRIVETGDVEQVLLRPAEPYTRELLAAVPRLSADAAPREDPRPNDADSALRLQDIEVRFGRGPNAVRALQQVSVTVAAGQTVGLVGESGSGKSTAARVALGLIRPDAGRVELFGRDLTAARGRARRDMLAGLGVVLQDPAASLDPRLDVGQCVAEPLHVHGGRMTRSERDRRVREMLEQVQLSASMLSRAPGELSGGQRQRVSLARALILRPRLLVADEPTSALDVSVQRSVLETIAALQAEYSFACLFVSHDLAVVQDVASHVVVLHRGRVVEQGDTRHTLVAPEDEYTRALLAAVPVPDPVEQRRRRAERGAA